MSEIQIPYRVLRPGATPPRAMSADASGYDLAAAEAATLEPGRVALVGTGLALAIPPGYEGQVRPRSGLALKHAVSVLNSPGTIDADYRGEVRIILFNFGSESHRIEPGDRIAQLVVQRVERVAFVARDELSGSTRGDGGFGHTGR